MSPTAPDVRSKITVSHSNNRVSTAAQEKAESDAAFSQHMTNKFRFTAAVLLTLRTLNDLAVRSDEPLARVAKLEQALVQQK